MSELTKEEWIEMAKSKKRRLWKNRQKFILKLDNERTEKQIIHMKKKLHTIKKNKVKNQPLRPNLINLVIMFQ